LALVLGTRLGVYDITVLIGEGGMGQVFAQDADRLARFQRERRSLAASPDSAFRQMELVSPKAARIDPLISLRSGSA
jgi:hypothetical protein